ncbi:MAG: serine hydrolase, partial [Betaproteobacteria bacterium]|nr:serine hydrolase [Betaproteobacteria bacterium]
MKKVFLYLSALMLVLCAGIQASGHGYIWKAISGTYLHGHSTAYIDDAENFAQRAIAKGTEQPWPRDARYNQKPLDPAMQEYHQQYRSAAFLVAQKGALVHESYYGA